MKGQSAHPANTDVCVYGFEGRDERATRSRALPPSLGAALLVFPLAAGAQQSVQPSSRRSSGRPPQPHACRPAHAALRDTAQPEHRHGHLGQSQRHLSLSRLRHVGRARRRQRAARPAGHRQGRLPERHGRAAPARRRPLHHAIQHHDLSEEDRRDRAPTSRTGSPSSPGSTTRRCTSSPAPASRACKELDGKKVNFSDVGSGTQFSTRLIFELLGIKATEINVGQADGYQMVKSGEIAATVLIAGKPTGSFAQIQARARHEAAAGALHGSAGAGLFPGQADARGLSRPHPQGQLASTPSPSPPCSPPTTGRATPTAIAAWPRSSMRSSPSSPSSRSRRATPSGRRPTSTPP